VKVRLKEQVQPAARDVPQLFGGAKSPPALMPLIDTALAVPLLIVALCGALVVFSVWLPKVNELGDTVKLPPPPPLPTVMVMVCEKKTPVLSQARTVIRCAPAAMASDVSMEFEVPENCATPST